MQPQLQLGEKKHVTVCGDLLWDMSVRGVSFRAPDAPGAATGEVRADPFPLHSHVLCVDLDCPVALLFISGVVRGFGHAVDWERLGVSVQDLGSVWAY